MPGFDPNEARDEHGRWSAFEGSSGLKIAASDKLKRWNIDKKNLDANNEYLLFHGTNMDAAKSIEKNGIKVPEGAGAGFFTLTTNIDNAKTFAKGQDNGSGFAVVEVKIPLGEITNTIWPGHNTSVYGNNDIQHGVRNGTLPSKYIKKIIKIE